IVTSDGMVATTKHGTKKTMRVETFDGRSFDANLVYAHPTLDLAILRLNKVPAGAQFSIPEFLPSAQLGKNEKAAAVGYHGALRLPTAFQGSYTPDVQGLWASTDTLKNSLIFTSDVLPGGSGSGMFNREGKLIGLLHGSTPFAPIHSFATRSEDVLA